jgi:hypothetical protein
MRDYYRCEECALIFADPKTHLSPEEERKRYDFHENDLNDHRYRAFLNQLATPMLKEIKPRARGLDFGSGPGPLMKLIFESQGHRVDLYDVFYAPDISVFRNTYDFITASEVAEHLYYPMKDLGRLWSCLKPEGHLGIMTSLFTEDVDFPTWHYIRDETHVAFYTPETMAWLAEYWGAMIIYQEGNVTIFTKRGATEKNNV